jgi:hypothetical protein
VAEHKNVYLGCIADQMERSLNERNRILRQLTPVKVQVDLDQINGQRHVVEPPGTGLVGGSRMLASVLL